MRDFLMLILRRRDGEPRRFGLAQAIAIAVLGIAAAAIIARLR